MSLPHVNPVDGKSAFDYAVAGAVHSNQVGRSSDYLIHKTAYGTTITPKPSSKVHDIQFLPIGWFRTAHAGIGDVVFIISGVTDMPSGSVSGSFPQMWVCDSNVPDKTMSDYMLANPALFPTSSNIEYIRQAGVNYEPQYPEPATVATLSSPNGRYWRALGGGGGSSTIDRFKISDPFTLKMDWFSASRWSPTLNDYDTTNPIAIAKPYYNRPSLLSDNIYGAPISYSYNDNSFRTSTINAVTQQEQLFRPYQTNDIIAAQQMASSETLVTGSISVTCNWREVNERVWAKTFPN